MVYLDIINEVLKNLREDEVASSTSNTYSKLISFFVKQAYIETSNAYQWPQLHETQDIAITAGDTTAVITGDSGEGVYDIHSVYNVTDECFLRASNYKSIQDKISSDTDQNKPSEYAYAGVSSAGSTINIYPTSDASYTLRVSYNRKPNLSNTFDDTTFIKVPSEVIILNAWSKAIAERGEDGGAQSNLVAMQAKEALSDAIALYESNNNSGNMDWNVV